MVPLPRLGQEPTKRALAASSALAACRLPFPAQPGDDRADLDLLGAVRDEEFGDHPLVDALDLHRCLVGLDLAQYVARLDRDRRP